MEIQSPVCLKIIVLVFKCIQMTQSLTYILITHKQTDKQRIKHLNRFRKKIIEKH